MSVRCIWPAAAPVVEPGTIVLDLRQPSALPFKAAYDLSGALAPSSREALLPLLFDPLVYLDFADLTNIWYSLESLGNLQLIKARQLAQRLAAAVRAAAPQLVVLVERWLTEDNLAFLWYLAQRTGCDLRFLARDGSFWATYAATFARLDAPESAADDLCAYPLQVWAATSPPAAIGPALDGDSPFRRYLLERQRLDPASDPFTERIMLIWQLLSTGATDLALCLLTLWHEQEPDGAQRDRLRMIRQMFLMGLQHFSLLYDDTPQIATDQPQAATLDFMQGYAALLLNHQPQATERFAAAGIDADLEPQQTHDLYQLNAFSLLAFRRGDIATARAVQQQIERYSAQPAIYNTNMQYTNQLNLGRIARATGDYPAALAHFAQAFAALRGCLEPADELYHHLLLADVYESDGDQRSALRHWFRAALVWAALPCKNAIHWRIQAFLLKRAFRMGQTASSAALAELLSHKLDSFAALGCYELLPDDRPLLLRVLEHGQPLDDASYIYDPLIALIGLPEQPTLDDPFVQTPSYRRLSQQLRSILATTSGAAALLACGSLSLDLQHGLGLPDSPGRVALRCMNLGIAGRSADTPLPIIAPAELWISRHPAIHSVTQTPGGWFARFRRYRPPARLSLFEFMLLHALERPAPLRLVQLQQLFAGLELPQLCELHDRQIVELADGPAERTRSGC